MASPGGDDAFMRQIIGWMAASEGGHDDTGKTYFVSRLKAGLPDMTFGSRSMRETFMMRVVAFFL